MSIAERLRGLRLEIEQRMIGRLNLGQQTDPTDMQLAGLLLTAEGLERSRAPVVVEMGPRLVTGR